MPIVAHPSPDGLVRSLRHFGGGNANVLMSIADDLNDWVGCLIGHPDVKTPNIDRLARLGLLFANAHCAAPVCNRSCVATFTGRRPSSTSIYSNAPVWHEVMPGVATIPQHFKDSGYYTAGGGKVYHDPPGLNRRGGWNEYFDQVFTGHCQARLASGEDVSNFTWPNGFPLNGLPEVKALTPPPRNAREFNWGPLDKQDNEMGDGQMALWAEKFLADRPKQPFFLAAGSYRPHWPWYAPRKYFEACPPDDVTPLIKEDDPDEVPGAGRRIAEQRRGDLELVRRSGQYQRVLQAYLANVTYCDVMVGRLSDALDAGPAAHSTIIVFRFDNPRRQSLGGPKTPKFTSTWCGFCPRRKSLGATCRSCQLALPPISGGDLCTELIFRCGIMTTPFPDAVGRSVCADCWGQHSVGPWRARTVKRAARASFKRERFA